MDKISKHHGSKTKRLFDLLLLSIFLIVALPLIVVIYVLILITSGGPVLFVQKRVGKNGRIFNIYKFRTMVNDAENKQKFYLHLNESDGPTFKIKNDPRFTWFGKLLSRFGFDELPQFINIIKGDMSLVGPRPLPVYEANKLKKHEKIREKVTPGITSLWVIGGSHTMSFAKWMRLDKDYVEKATLMTDILILLKTPFILFRIKRSF